MEALSAEIIASLEQNDERRLDRAQADLQDVLYELNREVRLQYEDEEGEGFFDSIRRTLTGDNEEERANYSRRTGYRDESKPRTRYRDDYDNGSGSSYGNDYSSGYNTDYQPKNLRSDPRSRNNSRDNYPEQNRRYQGNRSRNIPYQNDWDEDEDDWF